MDARIRDVLLLQLPGCPLTVHATHELVNWLIDQAADAATLLERRP